MYNIPCYKYYSVSVIKVSIFIYIQHNYFQKRETIKAGKTQFVYNELLFQYGLAAFQNNIFNGLGSILYIIRVPISIQIYLRTFLVYLGHPNEART